MLVSTNIFATAVVVFFVASASGLPTTQKASPGEYGDYFEGDMLLSPRFNQMRPRSGVIDLNLRWPNAVVPFRIAESFDKQDKLVIQTALAHLEKHTCIRFIERTDEQNFVHVNFGGPGSGYYSEVGMVGGRQTLNLEPNLVEEGRLGTVVHEFIHALGYFHEQSRTDRDEYVTINWSNVRRGKDHNFEKYGADVVDPHGVEYDYGSIMHYGAYGFALDDTEPTIIVPEGVTIGQRVSLSFKDIKKLNAMYCEQ